MDPGRFGHQQGWDNNSALDGNGAVHASNYRGGGSYDERRFPDERHSRGSAFHRDESYQDASNEGVWTQSRQSYGDEYSHEREPRRREKAAYMDSYDEMDGYRERGPGSYHDLDRFQDDYKSVEDYRDHEYSRPARIGGRDRDDYTYDDYDYRSHGSHHSRESSRDRDYDYGRRSSHDSDYDRGSSRRDGSWRRRESRDRERDRTGSSHDRDQSPRRLHERSRSCGHEDRPRSRSPRGRSYSRSQREDSYEDGQYDRFDRWRDHDDRHQRGNYDVAPSATVVVKGLSEKTTEEDLNQMLAEWGPLRHVRVIRERNSGISRGFAFIDFPSVEAARAMMDKIGEEGLVLDGRKVFFVYSRPTSGGGGHYGQENRIRSGQSNHRSTTVPSDWVCIICGCVNFARRMSCFQCNEPRTDDAPAADMALSNGTSLGRKGLEAGPTHVLVVRGLHENADEEMLRYEFSKHVPIKDLRLVRDKFTHVSRGFAFVHFHSVADATKALEATNGMTLDKNGQALRVAYAKSILGPGSGTSGAMQPSSLAAAAIEAASFAQQYDAVGWAPKEYNPDDKNPAGGQEQTIEPAVSQTDSSAPQSGFVWDEASGYYYDAASGFYYDGNTGLYYDGKNGTWYSYDDQSQQYIPCTDQSDGKKSSKESANSNSANGSHSRKAVISAPAATITSVEKAGSLSDAVQAAAEAALAAEKKEKDKAKEIRLASKSSILANKKKMNNVLTKWKQRSNEGQATRVALDDQSTGSVENKLLSAGSSIKSNFKSDSIMPKENPISSLGLEAVAPAEQFVGLETPVKSGGSLMGVIRGSGRGVVKSDMGPPGGIRYTNAASVSSASLSVDTSTVTSFRTDASALGSYSTSSVTGSGKRRFSEMPLPSGSANKEPSVTYRDRAAERRSLYGSSSVGDDLSDAGVGSSDRDSALRKDSMPFPPGVGGRGSGTGDANVSVQSYEVITKEKAIDESNVGNRMLRNMGWHEGLGLGKDGSGIVEPVLAQASEHRAGLGRQQKKLDPALEVQAGDSYKTLIHKKSIARFREMSETEAP